MPDRLGDFLNNAVPSRHNMMCPKCGDTTHASTPLVARLVMKVHRKYKCPDRDGKKISVSIMENAQQLIATADTVGSEAVGVSTAAAESLNATTQALAQVQAIIQNTSQTAATLLGEGHAATQTVTGSASVVVQKIEELMGQAQALRENITAVDALILAHGDSMRTAGQQAMGG